MDTKAITRLVPTLMAVRLVETNLKKKKRLVRLGIDNVVGTSLIQAVSLYS